MKNLFFLLLLVFSSFTIAQKKDCCKTNLDIHKLPSYSLKELGQEYQRLKALPENCCGHYNSDFQLIMNECSYQIKKQHLGKGKIIRLMGKPDEIEMPTEYLNYLKINKETEVLVYFWRNWHDFMYICLTNGKASKVDWFYAYE